MGFDSASFKRDMKQIRRELFRDVPAAVDHASRVLADEIRKRAPVETGRLRASVTVGPVKVAGGQISQSVVVEGGHDGPFVGAVEYGTRDEAPHPFFRPAVEAKREEMARIIDSALRGD
jgi:HK97 gp10 family phage protein